MSDRRYVIGLSVCLLFAVPATTQAQFRLFRGLRGSRSEREQTNAAHERQKNEADSAYQQGDYQRAVDLTTSVLREKPTDHVALYLRASSRIELGLGRRDQELIRQGIFDSREAIRAENGKTLMYYIPYLYGMTSLAVVENRNEHAKVATEIATKVLASDGLKDDVRAQLLYQRAGAHRHLENFTAAVADYEAAIKRSATHLGAYIGLAETHAVAGQEQKALESFQKTVEAFPDNPLVYNNRGMYLEQRKKRADAIIDFTRAVEIDDKYYYAYTNRGYALMGLGDPAAAEADYTMSLSIEARQPMVFHLRGAARLAQGKFSAAIEDQRAVLELTPRDAVAHGNLGHALFLAGNDAEAAKAFGEALAIDADLRHLEPWRYWALRRLGREADARTQLGTRANGDAKTRDWVDYVVAYLLDSSTEEALLAAVSSTDEEIKAAQLCEAHYFIGTEKQHAGRTEEAARHFQLAVDSKVTHLAAYRGAQFALERLVKKSKSADDTNSSDASGTIGPILPTTN